MARRPLLGRGARRPRRGVGQARREILRGARGARRGARMAPRRRRPRRAHRLVETLDVTDPTSDPDLRTLPRHPRAPGFPRPDSAAASCWRRPPLSSWVSRYGG
ncbi:hypothetical protein NKG05_11690 [Oerskovia sp. M15]